MPAVRSWTGSAASAEYYRRRRRVLYEALKHAVWHGSLSANPLDTSDQADWKPPAVAHAVDRRRVPNPAQMRDLLIAIGKVGRTQGPRLVALYGCMYYAMLRPSEAVSLKREECHLPAFGWGVLEFSETHSAAGKDWTDDGEVHEARAPKGGPKNAVRRVPIPPELVALLREHIDIHGTGPDGRLFRPTAAASISRRLSGGCSRRHGRSHSRPPRRPRQWPASPTTSGMQASPDGSTPECLDRRSPSGPGTAWRSSTGSTRHCLDDEEDRWYERMEHGLG